MASSIFFRSLVAFGFLFASTVVGMGQAAAQPSPTPAATPVLTSSASAKDAIRNPTAEQVVETALFVYGFGGGRAQLNQIRKTAVERGKIKVLNANGQMDQANYQKWTTRGETMQKERVRFDQEFPSARYSLVYTDEKTFLVFNDQVFTPRDDTARAFLNQLFYGIDSLLRYKENESEISIAGREKVGGVDFHLIDVVDKAGRKIRYFVSAKSFRVMMLEYEDEGIKYQRRFYDYKNAQGTLVPFRTVLFANGKVVEETDIGTVTYGQKIDESQFAVNQP